MIRPWSFSPPWAAEYKLALEPCSTLLTSPWKLCCHFRCWLRGVERHHGRQDEGAQTIIAVDLQPSRLEVALNIGATHALVGSDSDIVQQIRSICQPHNGVAFALDCSGAVPVIENMIDSLATRGRAVSVGAPDPIKRVSVNVFSHLTLGRQYVGCHQGDSVSSEVRCPYTTTILPLLSLTNATR